MRTRLDATVNVSDQGIYVNVPDLGYSFSFFQWSRLVVGGPNDGSVDDGTTQAVAKALLSRVEWNNMQFGDARGA